MVQIILSLLEPYTLLVMAAFFVSTGVWWLDRRRYALAIVPVLMGLLWLCSTTAAGYLALGTLEWSYPPADSSSPAAEDTIVVLAGDASLEDPARMTIRVGGETVFRCLRAAQLYQRAQGCRMIVSGGKLSSAPQGMSLAETMRDFLTTVGVQAADITLEADSVNTFENAVQTGEILRRHPSPRIYLVTSASHMRRAQSCFRRQGIATTPIACNHRALQLEASLSTLIPTVAGIHGVQLAWHEWLGIAWYWARGRI